MIASLHATRFMFSTVSGALCHMDAPFVGAMFCLSFAARWIERDRIDAYTVSTDQGEREKLHAVSDPGGFLWRCLFSFCD